MNINQITDATYIGEVVDHDKAYSRHKPVFYSHKLRVNYSDELESGFVDEHLSIVYFFCVNGEIYKIGQTSGKNGIKGCMSFYCSAGQDDPGQNRFTINALMREHIAQGDKVSVYIKFIEPMQMLVSGVDKMHKVQANVSAKVLEEVHLQDYRRITGQLPRWNFQEAGVSVPTYIEEQFASYKQMRAAARA